MPSPKIALVVITDGRAEYLDETLRSLQKNLKHRFVSRTIIDDSGNPQYGSNLDAEYPTFDRIHHRDRRGLAGAVETAWKAALETDAKYVWHQEEDFTFDEPVDLVPMVQTLDQCSNLAQLSLKRQSVNPTEVAAGGYMQVEPQRYTEAENHVEHDVCFTLNPCLIPRRVVEACIGSREILIEAPITGLLISRGFRFGIWGAVEDPPRVTHIGAVRSSGWHV